MDLNPYATGGRVYRGVSSAPNIGPLTNLTGYKERDKKYKTRQKNQAVLRRLQARQQKRYMSSEFLKPPGV